MNIEMALDVAGQLLQNSSKNPSLRFWIFHSWISEIGNLIIPKDNELSYSLTLPYQIPPSMTIINAS